MTIHTYIHTYIHTRRICSSLCDAASSLTRMRLRTRPRVIAKSATIKQTSRSGKVIFTNSDKNGVLGTYVHLEVSLLKATSTKSRFPGHTGARDAPSAGVSSRTGTFLGALDRWRLERWRPTALLQPSRCSPQLSCRVRGVFFGFTSTSRRVPWRLLWWRSPRAPSIGVTLHTGAPSLCSRPVPRPVVFHVPTLLLALLARPMICLLSGR